MKRARFVVAATLAGVSLVGVSLLAQTAQAPEMKSVLQGKKFTPPIKGAADIDYVKSPTLQPGGAAPDCRSPTTDIRCRDPAPIRS